MQYLSAREGSQGLASVRATGATHTQQRRQERGCGRHLSPWAGRNTSADSSHPEDAQGFQT